MGSIANAGSCTLRRHCRHFGQEFEGEFLTYCSVCQRSFHPECQGLLTECVSNGTGAVFENLQQYVVKRSHPKTVEQVFAARDVLQDEMLLFGSALAGACEFCHTLLSKVGQEVEDEELAS